MTLTVLALPNTRFHLSGSEQVRRVVLKWASEDLSPFPFTQFRTTTIFTMNQQPQANPGMHRNPRNLPMDQGGREWSNGLCDCCGDGCLTCCVAWYCPCFVFGQNKKRFDYLVTHNAPDPEHGGSGCGGDCCFYTLLMSFGFQWVLQCATRGNVRNRYQIKGGGVGDCCVSCFCVPCDLVQEKRELELEESTYPGYVKA